MSNWTMVNGVVELNTFANTSQQAKYMTECVINHLPLISGSEGSVNIFINQPSGYNVSSSSDELFSFSNLFDQDEGFDVQTKVVLTLNGHLRDVDAYDIYKQIIKWLTRLSKRISVDSSYIHIKDNFEKFCIDNPPYLQDMPRDTWFTDYQMGLLTLTNMHYGDKKKATKELSKRINTYLFKEDSDE